MRATLDLVISLVLDNSLERRKRMNQSQHTIRITHSVESKMAMSKRFTQQQPYTP
jgi:hypothetical protein